MNLAKYFQYFLIAAAALLALWLRTSFFLASTAQVPATSDEALAALIAKAIMRGERPLLFWGAPYQFPLESYLMAPFSGILPRNAFGARLIPALLAIISVPGFYALACKALPYGGRWPALLLVLLPSAYLMTLQSAYFIPEYTATFAFAWLLPLLAAYVLESDRPGARLLLSLGFLSGLALSTHLLSLPLVAAIAAAVCLGKSLRGAVRSSMFFAAAFAAGLLPYLATLRQAAASAGSVTDSYPIATALERLFSPLPGTALEVALGFNLTLFPDLGRAPGVFPQIASAGVWAFWVLTVSATAVAIYRFILRTRAARWPDLSIHDVFIATTWLCIFAFLLSKRSRPDEYRYLLPLAWCFPFLLAYVYAAVPRSARCLPGGLALLLVAVNILNTGKLISVWKQPDFRDGLPELQDVSAVISWLEKKGFDRCYASFWSVYRITYETDENIICSPPYNERFYGWPLPYLSEVNNSPRAAYVLSDTRFTRFPANKFLRMLRFHKLAAKLQRIGVFSIIYDFHYPGVRSSSAVAGSAVTLSSNIEETELPKLMDGNAETTWSSKSTATPGMWLDLQLDRPRMLHRVRIFFPEGSLKEAPEFTLEASRGDQSWTPLVPGLHPLHERLLITERHPIISRGARRDAAFTPTVVSSLRLRIDRARGEVPWEISEIEVYEATEE